LQKPERKVQNAAYSLGFGIHVCLSVEKWGFSKPQIFNPHAPCHFQLFALCSLYKQDFKCIQPAPGKVRHLGREERRSTELGCLQ